jgi:alanyl-tRNA synthetase
VTERLYYQDPYMRTFQARVVERPEIQERPGVVLDATAFYPTGGGQPHDTGTLNGVRVLDVQVARDGEIVHILDTALNQDTVQGQLDWERRIDHMQQHTGQHILSQAFATTCAAETVGFHLGEIEATLDLNRAPLSTEEIACAETLANQIVLEDREVLTQWFEHSDVAGLPLRKMPAVQGPVRIVQVAQFDWSPCGGTHVSSTGQVGPIKVLRTERRKKQTRIHFLCGQRALIDYVRKHEIVQVLAAHFTTLESEIGSSIQRLEDQVQALRKALELERAQMLEYQLAEWLAQAESIGPVRVIKLVFEDRTPSQLKEIARRITAQPGMAALLATRQPHLQLVFARSEDTPADMNQVMRAACTAIGGRGGGRSQFAQGGAPAGSSVQDAIEQAMAYLQKEQAGGNLA